MPRGTVDSAIQHIRKRWWKILCEVAVAAAIITCAMRLSASATYAVWEVIGVFFLVLLQAAFSAFVSRTKASYIFTEIILSFATVVSFFNLFFHGPEVWSVWLLSCLVAVLSIYAYSTLRNAALVTKVHVELLLLSLIVVLSVPVVQNLLSPQQIPNATYEPFQIVNSYGPVGAVHKGANTKWKNYEFECKPTNLWRRPCFAAPYHHHLDWLMVYIEPHEVPGAQEHLQKLIEERRRRRKEDEIRRRAEEEGRRKAQEEIELQRRLEAAREAAMKAKKQQEDEERMRLESETRRKQVEERKRQEELKKTEARKKRAQEEAEAEKRRKEEEAAAKTEEAKAKAEAAVRRKEQGSAEMQDQKDAVEKAGKYGSEKELERQRLEAEKLKKEEMLRVKSEEQRQQEEKDGSQKKEAEKAMQRQEERRSREEEATLSEKTKGRAKEKHEAQNQRAQQARFFIGVQNHTLGGVPLREAARLSQKKSHLRKRR
ncbi:hypothetical protein Emag_001750 [Eimeria magna]